MHDMATAAAGLGAAGQGDGGLGAWHVQGATTGLGTAVLGAGGLGTTRLGTAPTAEGRAAKRRAPSERRTAEGRAAIAALLTDTRLPALLGTLLTGTGLSAEGRILAIDVHARLTQGIKQGFQTRLLSHCHLSL